MFKAFAHKFCTCCLDIECDYVSHVVQVRSAASCSQEHHKAEPFCPGPHAAAIHLMADYDYCMLGFVDITCFKTLPDYTYTLELIGHRRQVQELQRQLDG
jgi:hypothetical protein